MPPPPPAAAAADSAGFAVFLQCAQLESDVVTRAATACSAWRAAIGDLAEQRPRCLDVVVRICRYDNAQSAPRTLHSLQRWLRQHASLVRSIQPLFGPRDEAREARRTAYTAARASKAHIAGQACLAELLEQAADAAGPAWQLQGYNSDCMACAEVLRRLPAGSLQQLALKMPHLGQQSDPSLPTAADIQDAWQRLGQLQDLSLVLSLVVDFPGHVRSSQSQLAAPGCWAALARLTRVTRLQLAVGLSPQDTQQLLQALPALRPLWQLHLHCSLQQPAGLDLAAAAAQLTHLALGLDRHLLPAPATTLPPRLRKLQLHSTVQPHQTTQHALGPSASAASLELDTLQQLTALEVHACTSWGDTHIFARLAALPQLQRVALTYGTLQAAGGDAHLWQQLLQLQVLHVHAPDDPIMPSTDAWRLLRSIMEGLSRVTSLTALQLHVGVLVPCGVEEGAEEGDGGAGSSGSDLAQVQHASGQQQAVHVGEAVDPSLPAIDAFRCMGALTRLRALKLAWQPEGLHPLVCFVSNGGQEPCCGHLQAAGRLGRSMFGDVAHLAGLTNLTSLQLRGFEALWTVEGGAGGACHLPTSLKHLQLQLQLQLHVTHDDDARGAAAGEATLHRMQPHPAAGWGLQSLMS